jgi:hypothetical protein
MQSLNRDWSVQLPILLGMPTVVCTGAYINLIQCACGSFLTSVKLNHAVILKLWSSRSALVPDEISPLCICGELCAIHAKRNGGHGSHVVYPDEHSEQHLLKFLCSRKSTISRFDGAIHWFRCTTTSILYTKYIMIQFGMNLQCSDLNVHVCTVQVAYLIKCFLCLRLAPSVLPSGHCATQSCALVFAHRKSVFVTYHA